MLKQILQMDNMDKQSKFLSTGDLARRTGVSLRTIRFYVEAGLLTPIESSCKVNRCKYAASAITLVEKIRLFAECGMKLSKIRDLFHSIESISSERKARTLFLRNQIEDQLRIVAEKEKRFRDARLQLEYVLDQTLRCPTCPSRGEKQDCGSCRNLKVLEAAAFVSEKRTEFKSGDIMEESSV